MNVYLLARSRKSYSTRRFLDVARPLDVRLSVLDPLKCTLVLSSDAHRIFYEAAPIRKPDLVLGRLGPATREYGVAVTEQFEMMDVPTVNDSASVALCSDAIRSLQILAQAGVPVANSVMLRTPRRLDRAVAMVGGMPVVVKLLDGNHELGSLMAASFQAAESTLETLWVLGQNIMLQQFHGEQELRELRALVVGGRVLAAVARATRSGHFRSAASEPRGLAVAEVTPDLAAIATQAAAVMGLAVATVELYEGAGGVVVSGLNSTPVLEPFERLAGIDAAGAILDFACTLASRSGEAGLATSAPGVTDSRDGASTAHS